MDFRQVKCWRKFGDGKSAEFIVNAIQNYLRNNL